MLAPPPGLQDRHHHPAHNLQAGRPRPPQPLQDEAPRPQAVLPHYGGQHRGGAEQDHLSGGRDMHRGPHLLQPLGHLQVQAQGQAGGPRQDLRRRGSDRLRLQVNHSVPEHDGRGRDHHPQGHIRGGGGDPATAVRVQPEDRSRETAGGEGEAARDQGGLLGEEH